MAAPLRLAMRIRIQIASSLWAAFRGIPASIKDRRLAKEHMLREAERLDRIRNPHKYQGR